MPREPLAVYDGQRLVGSVRQAGNEFIASDGDGRIVGRFKSQRQALDAIPIPCGSERPRPCGSRANPK
jgi:hypothetical protein